LKKPALTVEDSAGKASNKLKNLSELSRKEETIATRKEVIEIIERESFLRKTRGKIDVSTAEAIEKSALDTGLKKGLGDVSTSPWLADKRIGVVTHLEQFREGGSYLVPKSSFEKRILGVEKIGRPDGQFITNKSAMDKLLDAAGGNRQFIREKLGIPKDKWNEPLIRVDVHNPLLHNARLPSGFEKGARPKLFIWGGYTKGGMPEVIIDQIPQGGFSFKVVIE